MRFKSKVKRLEFELPLNTDSEVYDNYAEEDRKVKCLKLSSSEIDTKSSSYAVSKPGLKSMKFWFLEWIFS